MGKKLNKDLENIVSCAQSFVFGLDIDKSNFSFQCSVRYQSTDKAQRAIPATKDLIAIAMKVWNEDKGPTPHEAEKMLNDFVTKLLQKARVEQQDVVVRLHSSSTLNIPRFVTLGLVVNSYSPNPSRSSKSPSKTSKK